MPARVSRLRYSSALLVSKLVNCTHRSLRMHEEQRRDAAWQTVCALTEGGREPLPKDWSYRKLAAAFDISKNTVQRMVERASSVDPTEYEDVAVDPATRWPRWQWVRTPKATWKDLRGSMTPDELAMADAVKLLQSISELIDRASPASREIARSIMAENRGLTDASSDAVDCLFDLIDEGGSVSP